MSWHTSDERTKGDDKPRHPTDGKQCKDFDAKFMKEFGDEARTIRFALSTDGRTRSVTLAVERPSLVFV